MYTYDEAFEASVQYFNGDELAAKVFVDKYALRTRDGTLLEKTPTDMHRRIARELARVERIKYKDTSTKPLNTQEIFEHATKYHHKVYNFSKPIIAAVNGSAMAGGMDLAAMCDLRIISSGVVPPSSSSISFIPL